MIGIDQMSGYFRFAYGVDRAGRRHRRGAGGRRALRARRDPRSPRGRRDPPEVIRPRLRDLLPSRQEWREAHLPIWRGTAHRVPHRHHPGLGARDLDVRLLRRRAQDLEAPGGVRPAARWRAWRARSRRTTRRPPAPSCPCWRWACPACPIAALLLAAMMVHGVTPGPLLIQQDPKLFWGFIASMYVGNVILLDPQPAAGRALREPAARAVPGAVPDHPRLLDPGRLRRQQQRGRRVDHARHGRARATSCASSTSRRRRSCWGWCWRR